MENEKDDIKSVAVAVFTLSTVEEKNIGYYNDQLTLHSYLLFYYH